MHSELTGVAAGVRTDLALERPLVVVDAQVLLQAAAVGGSIRAVLALVRLLARVRAAVHVELVSPAEALVTHLTLKWLLACGHGGQNVKMCKWTNSPAYKYVSQGKGEGEQTGKEQMGKANA